MHQSRLRAAALALLWGLGAVQAAINLDGTPAVDPLTDDDPAPIASINTYHPDEHDCPLPCSDVTNVHSWITYHTTSRLSDCTSPLLLSLSLNNLLSDPLAPVLIKACTLTPTEPIPAAVLETTTLDSNPKLDAETYITREVDTAKACFSNGLPTKHALQLFTGKTTTSPSTTLQSALAGLTEYFSAPDNCDAKSIFTYHNGTVAGVYLGQNIGKTTLKSALEFVAQGNISSVDHSAAQLCDGTASAERTFGIAVDTTGNLAAVQKTVAAWSKGQCVDSTADHVNRAKDIEGVEIFAIGGLNGTIGTNGTTSANGSTIFSRVRRGGKANLAPRAMCRAELIVSHDDCAKLRDRCGITTEQFYKFNPKSDLCSTLMPGNYVCCSEGDPYEKPKPEKPKPGANGVCATHLIVEDDNCFNIAEKYGVTIAEIEEWNNGKTWAWSSCDRILHTYNMCVSEGNPPLPPPAAGTECGPLKPGTQQPALGVSMAELNPCPLKACCSNWGYCGVFPQHCDVTSPKEYGPGATKPGVQNTCVSNCGMDIKQNSGPPAQFGRIGYYESWNLGRDCLWLQAKDANTDGSYTHIHWAFADIDPVTWKPVINDTFKQWADFKKLKEKKIVAFGGWAYSTEKATYNIIRRAILENGNTFATNIAKFLIDEGLDGVDIDWEYPGAPDIKVDGVVIGQEGDGRGYWNFLRTLKEKVGSSKSVSIAAPASFYYLKAFPIDRIASVIDYIVYMTYDLHGQWDAGKKNSFDACDSGYCIRSHVNLTETRNTLAIITKAGVPNNKIFVGEASYGRSFRMKDNGCWGPMCEFTGTPEESFATAGRCTKTAGYLAQAEIMEIIAKGGKHFHDHGSNTDVMLYNGDYVAYMTDTTKNTRRDDWKKLNFAGSIDWAVDLQSFSLLDRNKALEPPPKGTEGCNYGMDYDVETVEMCEFACKYGVCPEPLCDCRGEGIPLPLPAVKNHNVEDIYALDHFNVDKTRLCKFACKYGYCPDRGCYKLEKDDPDSSFQPGSGGGIDDVYFDPYDPKDFHLNKHAVRELNNKRCTIYEGFQYRERTMEKCKNVCKTEVEEAQAEGRTTNYGCVGFFPLDKPIPWDYQFDSQAGEVYGRCVCDHGLVNILADLVIDALPAIAQIGCYIAMSTLKLIVDIGVNFIPGGKIIDFGLDAVATAAQMINYAYGPDEDPLGAFEWWLSPCGGSDLVPEDLKRAFDILGTVADGATSFKKPEKHGKHSGKYGDASNPKRDSDERTRGRGPGKSGSGAGGGSSSNKPVCKLQPQDKMKRKDNRLILKECVNQPGNKIITKTTTLAITSVVYQANAVMTPVAVACDAKNGHNACMGYSSAIAFHKDWERLSCPPEAGTTGRDRKGDKLADAELTATDYWSGQHHKDWEKEGRRAGLECERDEYPPYYLLNSQHPAWRNSGNRNSNDGQVMRWVPRKENGDGGKMWRGVCFYPAIHPNNLADRDFRAGVLADPNRVTSVLKGNNKELIYGSVTVKTRPYFTINDYAHTRLANPPTDYGHWDNPCWPKNDAPLDPGFCLLDFDPWNKAKWTQNNPNPYAQAYLVPP
ncbi:hypothetical protein QBC34DRAFT_355211 [Podospora aff. communis PSN243]|uniref:chitinase n=1 Tax=Podospora aff. communis PSN243 TaxID=3040156 RepID=A0AAV9GEX2_9PEZI|nr:hypothetical protein QBC34DRAFT_355211 [Podospora aff. communis PSN243]